MTCELVTLCIGANDPPRVARFWAGLLERETADDGLTLLPREPAPFEVRVLPTREPKTRQNQLHLDLTSASTEQQHRTIATVLELGGRHIDIGQDPLDDHDVLADPEGNELCVIPPGNAFLAGCGFIGALNGDGLRDVGHFWSRALGWPLVWDQDEETAIQSPDGGPKMSWGGPPVTPKTGRNRLHLHVAPRGGDDLQAEVDRLVSLGATRLDAGTDEDDHGSGHDVERVAMADPGGNEFCVVASR